MLQDLYQEYLYLIGKLKDAYSYDVDVEHKDIHTFYKNKRPLFKLFFGMFTEDKEGSIVVSFHLDLYHAEAIQLFFNMYKISPVVQLHDSYIEDANGETYLGEDAIILQEVYQAQEILSHWLENSTKEDIKEYAEAKVLGRSRDPHKMFDSRIQKDEAIIEFERIRKPDDDEDVH